MISLKELSITLSTLWVHCVSRVGALRDSVGALRGSVGLCGCTAWLGELRDSGCTAWLWVHSVTLGALRDSVGALRDSGCTQWFCGCTTRPCGCTIPLCEAVNVQLHCVALWVRMCTAFTASFAVTIPLRECTALRSINGELSRVRIAWRSYKH